MEQEVISARCVSVDDDVSLGSVELLSTRSGPHLNETMRVLRGLTSCDLVCKLRRKGKVRHQKRPVKMSMDHACPSPPRRTERMVH